VFAGEEELKRAVVDLRDIILEGLVLLGYDQSDIRPQGTNGTKKLIIIIIIISYAYQLNAMRNYSL
jgi:hypothetical protein